MRFYPRTEILPKKNYLRPRITRHKLEKERSRRYDTVNGLTMDLQRYLHDEPVLARPPTVAYKFHKAWRRNRAGFLISGLFVVTIIGSLAISVILLIKAERAEAHLKHQLTAIGNLVLKIDLDANSPYDLGSTTRRLTGVAIGSLGRSRAVEFLDHLIANSPDVDVEPLYKRSIIRLFTGDLDGYRSDCRAMLRDFENTDNESLPTASQKAACLSPQSLRVMNGIHSSV